MPRIPRGQVSGFAYHVINRGNGGATVFRKEEDYRAFLDLLAVAKTKHPVMLLGFCLMPNHLHFVVQPKTPEALSAFIPIPLPIDWNHLLETPLSLQELSRIRTAVNRQAPFGSPDWQTMIAKLLGLVSSLTPRGRPRKIQEK